MIWAVSNENQIYSIDKDGTPPTLATDLSEVYAISLGKFSLVRNGAWALAGPNRDIYFFNVSHYDKDPWVKVPSIDVVRNADIFRNADIVTTLFNTFLLQEDGKIYYRKDISKTNPVGTQWSYYENGNGISESK